MRMANMFCLNQSVQMFSRRCSIITLPVLSVVPSAFQFPNFGQLFLIKLNLTNSCSSFSESCDYFMIPFNSEIVKCDNLAELMHELSNIGARDEFGKLVEELIVPTLVAATKKGEREIRLGNTAHEY